jgi:lysophospholipase L1-like esterase
MSTLSLSNFSTVNISTHGDNIGAFTHANEIVIFGDSITELCGQHPTDRGYFNWTQAILSHPFKLLYNAGVGGNSTTQMLARVATDVTAYSPDWVLVMGGINDVASGVSAATIYTNLTTMYETFYNLGYHVIGCTLLPSSSFDTAAERLVFTTVNTNLRAYAAAHTWLWFADIQPLYDDGNSNPLATYTADGVHPSALGAAVIGQKFATLLDPWASFMTNDTTLAVDNSTTNRLYYGTCNPLMTPGTAGTVTSPATGTAPTGWQVQSGGAWSIVARTDGLPGAWAQVVADGSNLNNILSMFDITAGVSPGIVVRAQCEFETTNNWTSPEQFELNVQAIDSGSTVLGSARALGHSTGGGSGSVIINPGSGVLRTADLTLPANTAKVRTQFWYRGAGGTVRVSRFEVKIIP